MPNKLGRKPIPPESKLKTFKLGLNPIQYYRLVIQSSNQGITIQDYIRKLIDRDLMQNNASDKLAQPIFSTTYQTMFMMNVWLRKMLTDEEYEQVRVRAKMKADESISRFMSE